MNMGSSSASAPSSPSAAPATGNSSNRRHRSRNNDGSSVARLLAGLRSMLQILLWPLTHLFRLLLPCDNGAYDGLSAAVTAKAAQHFVDYLRSCASATNHNNGNSNNNSHEAWLTTGFAAAQEQASQQQSLLLVYLHSPLHRSAENFCQSVLCHESMDNFIQQPKITAFGVSIHTAQGAYLAQLLQATSYPFVALLQPKLSNNNNSHNNNNAATNNNGNNNNNMVRGGGSSTTTMTLLMRAEGPALMELSVPQLLPHLQTALQRHQRIVAEAEARRLQRQEELELRRQQDEEYQQALQADQERERARREEEEREAQRLQALQQAEEQQVAQAAATLDQARALVPPEPDASAGNVATIRFVLPTGTKLNRKFDASETTVAGLLAFLTVHIHDNQDTIQMSNNLGLSTNFPKKSYHDGDTGLTLREAGLAPQAVLMVQDLDA